jgi:hypothetical protein
VAGHLAAARSLTVLAKKYLAVAVGHTAEGRRIAPVLTFLPTKFLKPREALHDVRDVENWSQALHLHVLFSYASTDLPALLN